MWNTARNKASFAGSALSVPRLRLGPVSSRRTLLAGGWWPRSADPVAELPGLIRAIDDRRGLVTRLMLGPGGWDSQPRWLGGAGRAVPLDWFPGQPAGLVTAFGNGDPVDLLIVPPAPPRPPRWEPWTSPPRPSTLAASRGSSPPSPWRMRLVTSVDAARELAIWPLLPVLIGGLVRPDADVVGLLLQFDAAPHA